MVKREVIKYLVFLDCPPEMRRHPYIESKNISAIKYVGKPLGDRRDEFSVIVEAGTSEQARMKGLRELYKKYEAGL